MGCLSLSSETLPRHWSLWLSANLAPAGSANPRPLHAAALLLRVAPLVAACDRVRQLHCYFRGVRPPCALCQAGCKRSDLKPSRSARERRSNTRPLSQSGCTHTVHVEASCSDRAIALIVRRRRAAMLAACSSRADVGVAARGWAFYGCDNVALMLRTHGSIRADGGCSQSAWRRPRRRPGELWSCVRSAGTLTWPALTESGRRAASRVVRIEREREYRFRFLLGTFEYRDTHVYVGGMCVQVKYIANAR